MMNGFILDDSSSVPPPCSCRTNLIDCYNTGIQSVPIFNMINLTGSHVDINLAYNNITEIKNYTFRNIIVDNNSLVALKLQNNVISDLADSCFEGIENTLHVINLTDNQIRSLPTAIRNLPNLQELHKQKSLDNDRHHDNGPFGKTFENFRDRFIFIRILARGNAFLARA